MTVSFSDLTAAGIAPADLEPFLLRRKMKEELSRQNANYNNLDRHPLVALDAERLGVARPSALSVAVRDHIIRQVLRDDHWLDVFDDLLAKAYSGRLAKTPFVEIAMSRAMRWRKHGAYRLMRCGIGVDQSHGLACLSFLPTLRIHDDGGFGGMHVVDATLVDALQASINQLVDGLAREQGFRGGLVLLVACGWGKGSMMMSDLGCDSTKWRLQHVSAADLLRLGQLEGFDAGYLWRFFDGLDAAESEGIRIANLGGLVNLVGWVRSNDGHFVPYPDFDGPPRVSPGSPLALHVSTDFSMEVRAEADRELDLHLAVDNVGRCHELVRADPDSPFSSPSSRRVYGSVNALWDLEFVTVCEGARSLWISLLTPNIDESDLKYRLANMTNVWLHRIVTAIERRTGVPDEPVSLLIYLEFRDAAPPSGADEIPVAEEDLAALCRIEEHHENNACKVIFDVGFFSGFRLADNLAERLLVRILTRAILRLCGEEDEEGLVQAVETEVVPNDNARFFHIFHAHRYLDYVQGALPEALVEIDELDHAAARVGLAWRVSPAPDRMRIDGRKECTEFLAQLVDVLIEELDQELGSFDRISAIRHLVLNCEKADAEERRWRITSAANLGLHGPGLDTTEHFVRQLSRFAGARSASRILVEMALCACPTEGGVELSPLEMSKLIARASLIVSYGGVSDAIHFNVLAPEISFTPLGDVHFREEFNAVVAEPTLSRMLRDQVVSEAPFQRIYYQDPRSAERKVPLMDEEFWAIWKKEMGFDREQAVTILDLLEEEGRKRNTAVLEIRQSRYLELACAGEILSEGRAKRFLEQFSLSPRPSWSVPPPGFTKRDIYPWRFGRRLSYIARAILRTDDSPDPVLLIAPGALRTSVVYVLEGARRGRLDRSFFRTRAMRDTWLGKAREGHTFNAKVAQKFSQAGWSVRENLSLPQLLNRHLDQDWGDVDVLAWREGRGEVLVIEAKDLAPARNLSEIAALLSEYQGVARSGKPDKLGKHLNRIKLLRENLDGVRKLTGGPVPQIVSCLVFSSVVPMQYASIDALLDTKVGTLEEVLTIVG